MRRPALTAFWMALACFGLTACGKDAASPPAALTSPAALTTPVRQAISPDGEISGFHTYNALNDTLKVAPNGSRCMFKVPAEITIVPGGVLPFGVVTDDGIGCHFRHKIFYIKATDLTTGAYLDLQFHQDWDWAPNRWDVRIAKRHPQTMTFCIRFGGFSNHSRWWYLKIALEQPGVCRGY